MADVSEHYISVEKIGTTINHILDVHGTNSSVETKTMDKLSEIKSTIQLNNKTLDNKSDSILKTMNQYTTNYMGCVDSFKAIVGRYETAVSDASAYIQSYTRSQKGE